MLRNARLITKQHFVFVQQESVGKRDNSVVITTWALCKRVRQNENKMKKMPAKTLCQQYTKHNLVSAVFGAHLSQIWYAVQLLPGWDLF